MPTEGAESSGIAETEESVGAKVDAEGCCKDAVCTPAFEGALLLEEEVGANELAALLPVDNGMPSPVSSSVRAVLLESSPALKAILRREGLGGACALFCVRPAEVTGGLPDETAEDVLLLRDDEESESG